MDIVFPFIEPFKNALFLSQRDLRHQITLLKKMVYVYGADAEFYDRCKLCYEKFLSGNKDQSRWWSRHALIVKPEWLNEERCRTDIDQLQAKYPKLYDNAHARAVKEAHS